MRKTKRWTSPADSAGGADQDACRNPRTSWSSKLSSGSARSVPPAQLRPSCERSVQQYDREGHQYARMSVKQIMMGTQEKIDIDQLGLRVKVSEHARVRFDEDSHSFVYVVRP